MLFACPNYIAISLEDDDLGFWHVRRNLICVVSYSHTVMNWHKASGFPGLFNTKDHGKVRLYFLSFILFYLFFDPFD